MNHQIKRRNRSYKGNLLWTCCVGLVLFDQIQRSRTVGWHGAIHEIKRAYGRRGHPATKLEMKEDFRQNGGVSNTTMFDCDQSSNARRESNHHTLFTGMNITLTRQRHQLIKRNIRSCEQWCSFVISGSVIHRFLQGIGHGRSHSTLLIWASHSWYICFYYPLLQEDQPRNSGSQEERTETLLTQSKSKMHVRQVGQ